jgi:hypothetical protein
MPVFLAALDRTGNAAYAARRAGVSRQWAYACRQDPEQADFSMLWDECMGGLIDLARAAAFERGIHGWEEPVFGSLPGEHSGSGEVGKRRKFDNRLLTRVLEVYDPQWRGTAQAAETEIERDTAARAREFLTAAFASVPGAPPRPPEPGAKAGEGVAAPGRRKAKAAVRMCVECGARMDPGHRACPACGALEE